MNYLAVCAIAHNEKPYLNEWLRYHLLVGVTQFYIYDNDSNDGTLLYLHNYPITCIKLHQMHGIGKQRNAYTDCLMRYRNDSRWIAFIDIDEFLVPIEQNSMLEVLPKYEQYSAVLPHWRVFGSNGHLVYSTVPVLERFTKRENRVNPHVKSIVDPNRTKSYITPHKFCHTTPGVDEHFNIIADTDSVPGHGTCDIMQVNHYVVKSKAECMLRRQHPRADTGQVRDAIRFFDVHDINEITDLRALSLYQEGTVQRARTTS